MAASGATVEVPIRPLANDSGPIRISPKRSIAGEGLQVAGGATEQPFSHSEAVPCFPFRGPGSARRSQAIRLGGRSGTRNLPYIADVEVSLVIVFARRLTVGCKVDALAIGAASHRDRPADQRSGDRDVAKHLL